MESENEKEIIVESSNGERQVEVINVKTKKKLFKNYKDGQIGSLIFKVISIIATIICFVFMSFAFGMFDNVEGLSQVAFYLFVLPLFILPFGIGLGIVVLVLTIINLIVFFANLFNISRVWKISKGSKAFVIFNFLLSLGYFLTVAIGIILIFNLV